MSLSNSNTLKLARQVISNPKRFAGEWRTIQHELSRSKEQLDVAKRHIAQSEQKVADAERISAESGHGAKAGVMSDGYLDEVTCSQAIGWAVSADGKLPLLALAINGEKVLEFRPSVNGSDVKGRFRIPIEVVADAEVAVTDLGGRHLRNSPMKPRLSPHENAAYNKMLGEFLAEVRNRKGRLLEIGSRARSGNTYRHLFPTDIHYVGLDVADGPNVDVVGDAHRMSKVLEGRFDFAFSISTFEHILMPWVVALELNRVMKTGGLAFIQSHQTWPAHEEPWDFWRFSVNGWKSLFNLHTGFELVSAAYDQPASIRPLVPNPITASLAHHRAFLISGCVARKVGDPIVKWDADVDKVFDLHYSHGTECCIRSEPITTNSV